LHAVLIPNLEEYHAVSIKRYAQELTEALVHLNLPQTQIQALTCHHVEWVAALLPPKLGLHSCCAGPRGMSFTF
jgi:hypothetical protein